MTQLEMDELRALEKELAELKQHRDSIEQEIARVESELEAAKSHQREKEPPKQQARFFGRDMFSSRKTVKKSSLANEKYELFCELFSGRLDVHGRRFESSKSGLCGYMPVCANEFKRGVCFKAAKGKDKVRCVACCNQAFSSISFEEFEAHTQGKASDNSDVLGAYSIDNQGFCKFILVDFDEEGRKETLRSEPSANSLAKSTADVALTFCEFCWKKDVPVYLERSRSGRGFHVWLFFTNPVSARSARQLMTALLTTAMSEDDVVKIKHYDMIIPRQDTISKTGFGNLVALPFQGNAGKRMNSLFVNETLQPYPDQWEFLSTIRKLTPLELENTLGVIAPNLHLGELVNFDDEESTAKPWEKRKQEVALSKDDFAGTLEIVKANMLHIPIKPLSPKARNKIRRLAAFSNPEFYQKQASRLETRGTPRVICTADETQDYLSLPRGTEMALIELLTSAEVDYRIEDKTESGQSIDVSFNGKLRESQILAVKAMLEHDCGTLSAPTGFGKTMVGAYLISKRAVNTLVIVPTRLLLDQWLDALNVTLNIKEDPPLKLTPKGRKKKVNVIGQYGGSKKNASGIVDVAIFQSLQDRESKEVHDFVKDYGLVIVDECHRMPAPSFEAILKHINAKYVYGLSATPYRDDGHDPIIFLECGPIRYKVDPKEQAKERPFEHFLIPRFTYYSASSVRDEKNYSQMLNALGEDSQRNKMIVDDVTAAIKSGRKPLVLSERTEHVSELAKSLKSHCDTVITLTGGMPSKEKKTVNERLATLGPDDDFVIVATGKYVGEGFDMPMLDTLFLAMPIAFKGKVAQYTGRLNRLFEGKREAIVYDYVDANVGIFEKMFHKRMEGYRSVGYKAVVSQDNKDAVGTIIYKDDYWQQLKLDLAHTGKELVISSPRLTDYQVGKLMEEIAGPLTNGVVITVITRPVSEYWEAVQSKAELCIKRLEAAGIKVQQKPGGFQQFAVIDKSTVWYGNLNLLSNSLKDDKKLILRLVDSEVAVQLISCSFS